MTYPIDRIRADFPILGREIHGKPLVYLDNGASAQKPTQVLDATRHAYENEYANVHRGLHFLSNAATDSFEAARGKVAKFLNAPSENNIVWTSGTTDAINLVAHGWAIPNIEPGDEIVLSILEHHSNIVPWHFLRERHGAVLKWVDCDESGAVSLEAVEAACTDRTKLIAITHMSNVTGGVLPVKEICAMGRARGIRTLIDGSQGAVHMPVDVQDIDCDFYCITGH